MTNTADTASWAARSDTIRNQVLFGEGQDSVLVLTPGIQNKGKDYVESAVRWMIGWRPEWFDTDSDPEGLHDLAVTEHFGERIFFKVDPLPGKPDARLITIGLMTEW